VHADDVRGQEINRLSQHARLGLDAADAPAHDADAVDHRGVRVGADECIRIVNTVGVAEHALGEELQIDLVHDADAGRHDLEGVERLHAPLEELVALAVARELEFEVLLQCVGRARKVHLHRMVDDQVNRHERLDDLRILAHPRDRRPHGGKVDQQRHAGEILQDDARDDERNLLRARRLRPPAREIADRAVRQPLAVAVAQQGLEHEPDRHRQARHLEAGLLERRQRIEAVRGAVRGERLQRVEGIREIHGNCGLRIADCG
jgi:hypothetical protein